MSVKAGQAQTRSISGCPGPLAAAEQALGIFHRVYGQEPGPHWWEVVRALSVCGAVIVKTHQPVAAVAPFTRGMP